MRKVLLLFLILGLPAAARAEWAMVPVETLVQESDIIVVGTLRDVSEYTADWVDYGQGHIVVREVIWGRVSPGDSLLLKWSNASALACPRVEHRGRAGWEGIWLLTPEGDAVSANHPGRFVELSERRQVEAALARSPVVLRSASYWVGDDEPMRLSVVYRNVSDVPREFPSVAFEGGKLRLAPDSRLSVRHSPNGDSRVAWRALAAVSDPRPAPVTVEPRGEHRVELDLRDMLSAAPKDDEFYDIKLKLAGLPGTNEKSFHMGRPPFTQPSAEPPAVNYSRVFKAADTPAVSRGLAPIVRAGLTAFAFLILFPFFRILRAALIAARLSRVTHGAQTWQI